MSPALENRPVEIVRQPGDGGAPAAYEAPTLLHIGDEVDALLAVRLDPTQEDDDDA